MTQTQHSLSLDQIPKEVKKQPLRLKSFKLKSLTEVSEGQLTFKIKKYQQSQDALVRQFIEGRQDSKTLKKYSLLDANLIEKETPQTPSTISCSMDSSSIRNNWVSKNSFRGPTKSLPKVRQKAYQIKNSIKNCKLLSQVIQAIKGEPGKTPIHSHSKDIDEVCQQSISLPQRPKVKLQPIKESLKLEREINKYLIVSNVERNINGSINRGCFRQIRFMS